MKNYVKLIVLSSILLVVIVLIVLTMTMDVDLKIFKTLSIAGVSEKAEETDALLKKQTTEETTYDAAVKKLETEKSNYDKEKSTYDNIDNSTLEIVQEATKNEKYFIEYLWIVLGNYASSNDLAIDIITSSSTSTASTASTENSTVVQGTDATTVTESNKLAGTAETSGDEVSTGTGISVSSENNTNANTNTNTTVDTNVATNTVKIVVTGRYSNVADFVFDVENDRELKFKLDNISMSYVSDNRIKATFNVLSLAISN